MDARIFVHHDRAVMKHTRGENWHCGKFFAVGFGANISGNRKLADVELGGAHHAPEGRDQRLDILKVHRESVGRHRSVDQRRRVPQRAEDGFEI